MAHLISIDDLADQDISSILLRAGELADGATVLQRPFAAALLFLSSSLRTRLGFGVAISRLGGSIVDVSEMRWDQNMGAAESFDDALRTVTGMADLTIVRAPVQLADVVRQHATGPVVCGGDAVGHPTQALIDTFAIERLRGPLAELTVAIAGDLGMRATRSLLQLLSRRPPRALVLISPPTRRHDVELSPELAERTRTGSLEDLAGIDVLSMCGLAPVRGADQLADPERGPYSLAPHHLERLPQTAIVLSPMPVIDELTAEARHDPRLRMFEQSDLSVFVRMACVEWVRSQTAARGSDGRC